MWELLGDIIWSVIQEIRSDDHNGSFWDLHMEANRSCGYSVMCKIGPILLLIVLSVGFKDLRTFF